MGLTPPIAGAPRVLPHVSASQIKTFNRCERLWALEKLWYRRQPQTLAQSDGTAIHLVAQHYLKTGLWLGGANPDHIAIVKQAARAGNLPTPGPDLLIEHGFRLPTLPGLPPMVGFIDVVNPRQPPDRQGRRTLILDDHKSTGDFKYAMTPGQLDSDVQMNVYAHWGFDSATGLLLAQHTGDRSWEAGAEFIEASHVYQHKKRRDSRRVSTLLEQDQVEEQWGDICNTVQEMVQLAAKPPVNPTDIPGNYNACGDYGGCPHRTTCGVTQRKTLFNIKIGAERKDMERKGESLKERLAKQRAAQGVVTQAPQDQLANNVVRMLAPAALMPPDSPPRAQVVGLVVPAAGPQGDPDRFNAPKKRGRPAKAPVPVAAIHGEEIIPAMLSPFAQAAPKAADLAAGQPPTLLVDCVVAKGNDAMRLAVPLELWLRPIAEAVAKEFGVPHWSLVEYGKGRGALAAGIQISIDAGTLPPVVLVDSRVPGAEVFIEIASLGAAQVIKGVR